MQGIPRKWRKPGWLRQRKIHLSPQKWMSASWCVPGTPLPLVWNSLLWGNTSLPGWQTALDSCHCWPRATVPGVVEHVRGRLFSEWLRKQECTFPVENPHCGFFSSSCFAEALRCSIFLTKQVSVVFTFQSKEKLPSLFVAKVRV